MIQFLKDVFTFIVKLITGYYLFNLLFYLLVNWTHKNRYKHHTYIYIKRLPLNLTFNDVQKVRLISQFFFTVLFTSIVTLILLSNFAPLGVTTHYFLASSKEISKLGPKQRVVSETINGEKVIKQIHDLIYFTTATPYNYDSATVKVTYQNPNPDQTVSLGFQDQENWHYDMQYIDVPFLNDLSWSYVGDYPRLYQSEPKFKSIEDFLYNLPKDSIIGTFETNLDIGRIAATQLSDYKPSTTDTVIDVPLRGPHVLYVYLKGEPFRMSILKQDLNRYEDADPMVVKIYKGKDLVYQATEDDDGITDDSQKTMPPQELTIKNPGPQLPESGVYKVVIDVNTDTIIKQITTNLHKIVFQGRIFPAANKVEYGNVVASTSATTVYSNALVLGASTYHSSGIQRITVGNQALNLNTIKSDKTIIPQNDFNKIYLPKNDVVFNGYMGYFAFQPDQFFLPSSYRVIPILEKEDLDLVDYLLTDYVPSKKIGDWEIAERTFDIRSAFISEGKLKWIIQSPNLKDNKQGFLIKDINIAFHKKSWF